MVVIDLTRTLQMAPEMHGISHNIECFQLHIILVYTRVIFDIKYLLRYLSRRGALLLVLNVWDRITVYRSSRNN